LHSLFRSFFKEVLGEPEKAGRIESAKLKGIFEGWKEYFRENPTHGEYAGKICGCFVRLGKLKEMKELLKFIQETNEGKFEMGCVCSLAYSHIAIMLGELLKNVQSRISVFLSTITVLIYREL
jgi:hypothetical protein